MTTAPAPKKWYVGNWTGLGWLETGIKLVAHVVAFVALSNALQNGTPVAPEGVRLIQVIVLGLMALGLTAAIVDRFIEKEIIAMAFVIVNVVAHWGLLFTLFRQPGPGSLLTLFVLLMLIGDLVKIGFLVRTNFSVRGINPRFLIYLTGGVILMEVVLLLLSLSNT
jgi:hypothetical protein